MEYVASGPSDFPERNLRFTSEGNAELSQVMTRPGMAMTLTECAGENRLGISESRVFKLLRAAMHKLRSRNRAQLVLQMKAAEALEDEVRSSERG